MRIPEKITGWAAVNQGATRLEKREFPLPKLGDYEVLIQVQACGICHSDIHLIDNDWMISSYPLVPGHEIVGRIIARGKSVSLPMETRVGVGWQRSSCMTCYDCVASNENMCDKNLATCVGHLGGYADYHVTDSRFAFPIPAAISAERAAPLLCGGATVFNPLCEFLGSPSRRTASVGIVGLGGLGHLAVKFAAAMGCEVTLFSSTPSKQAEAKALGVHHYVSSKTADEISAVGRKLDLVLVTANVDLPWQSYLKTLRADGTLCFVGIPPSPVQFPVTALMGKRLRVASSPIASRTQITQMLDFAALHGIGADIETFPMDRVDDAITRVRENKVRYRAVLLA